MQHTDLSTLKQFYQTCAIPACFSIISLNYHCRHETWKACFATYTSILNIRVWFGIYCFTAVANKYEKISIFLIKECQKSILLSDAIVTHPSMRNKQFLKFGRFCVRRHSCNPKGRRWWCHHCLLHSFTMSRILHECKQRTDTIEFAQMRSYVYNFAFK